MGQTQEQKHMLHRDCPDCQAELAEALEPPAADGAKWGLHTHKPCAACLGKVAGRAALLGELAEAREKLQAWHARARTLEGERDAAIEEARLFETLFESRCKLLTDTKELGLYVCGQRDGARSRAERAEAEVARLREALDEQATTGHCDGCRNFILFSSEYGIYCGCRHNRPCKHRWKDATVGRCPTCAALEGER